MKTNPYNLNFGREPAQILNRYPGIYSIIDSFESDNPVQTYMLTGIRGSGKTVMMSGISKYFDKLEDWIVIDLTPDIDLIKSFNAELGVSPGIATHLKLDGVAISLPGLQLNVKGAEPITDERVAAMKMLEAAKKKNI
ncbi:MAG: ATP-binding protein, partial [Lachnospiraceae bacterium]|nr:ATP-binding protein [Lachnospiraceae bacterium]